MFTGILDGFLRGLPVEGNGVSDKGYYLRHEVDSPDLGGPRQAGAVEFESSRVLMSYQRSDDERVDLANRPFPTAEKSDSLKSKAGHTLLLRVLVLPSKEPDGKAQ